MDKSTDKLHHQNQVQKQQSISIRFIYTGIIFMGHLSLGLLVGILGPSLVDIRYLMTESNSKEPPPMHKISLNFTFIMIGAFFGAFISFLYKWKPLEPYLNRQLLTSILSLVLGITSGYMPQLHSINLYYGICFICGIGTGNWSAIATTWLIEMWTGTVLAAILQAVQLFYGVGTILGPLLVRPYLYGYMNETEVKTMNISDYEKKVELRRDSLTMPYAVVGASAVLVGLSLLILYITYFLRYRKYSPDNDLSKSVSSSSSLYQNQNENLKLLEQPENFTQLRIFICLVLFTFACNNLTEIAFINFLDTFLQSLDSVKISAAQAAEIGSITATSYTVGRGANILVSMVLSAENLLLLHYGLALFGFSAMLWSTRFGGLTWIRLNCCVIGYSFSAIMPSMFAYINTYTVVDDRRNAMFNIALAVPSIFTPLLIGHYIEHYPSVLLFLNLGALMGGLGLFLCIRFGVVNRTKRKCIPEKSPERYYQCKEL